MPETNPTPSPTETTPTRPGMSHGGAAPIIEVDKETAQPTFRAFPFGTGMAWDFVCNIRRDNRPRNMLNARITQRMSLERPWEQARLKSAGLNWKSNFTTRPLPTLVQRAYARFPRCVEKARYLTSACLPSDIPGSRAKSEFFRDEFSKFLRSDPRWNLFVDDLARETVTFGFASAGWLHDSDYFPTFWRQDTALFPSDTPPVASGLTLFVIRQDLLPHEAYEQLQLAISARDANDGKSVWNVDALIQSINENSSESERTLVDMDERRRLADMQRQLAQTGLYGSGRAGNTGRRKVIWWHLLARELTGKVTHLILSDQGKELFRFEDRWENFDGLVSLFTFENGDGSLQGSLGLGRVAYAMAQAIDRSRNSAVDRMELAGKIIIKGPQNSLDRFRMNVVGGVIAISNEWDVVPQRIDSNPDSAVTLDNYLRQLLDEMTGNTSPRQLEGDRVTAEQVKMFSGREDETADAYIDRWVLQFGHLVSGIQKRVLGEEARNADKSAADFYARLSQKLSPDEIEYLRTTPALCVVRDLTEQERQAIVVACTEGVGNPAYDQKALAREKCTAQVNAEFADRVLTTDPDPAQAAEQQRGQQMENQILLDGQPVPVSPRDNHAVHLQVLSQLFAPVAQEATANPAAEHILAAVAQHGVDHLTALKAAGGQIPPELGPIAEQVQALAKTVTDLQQHDAQHGPQNAVATAGNPADAGSTAGADTSESGGQTEGSAPPVAAGTPQPSSPVATTAAPAA